MVTFAIQSSYCTRILKNNLPRSVVTIANSTVVRLVSNVYSTMYHHFYSIGGDISGDHSDQSRRI
jgi:hypothetical protein